MARNKIKICLGCHSIFDARKDAKTCSTRCRKRYQRAREQYYETKPLVIEGTKVRYNYGRKALNRGGYAG